MARPVKAGALGLLAAVSFAAWFSAQRRSRAIGDEPTAKIASAAQGYSELVGAGRALGGIPVVSPITGLPCLWYRYVAERRERGKWVRDGDGESDASFVLDDGSGQCLVDPEGGGDARRAPGSLVTRRSPLYAVVAAGARPHLCARRVPHPRWCGSSTRCRQRRPRPHRGVEP